MRPRYLQSRFILAGVLMILATVISGAWSAFTFARLSRVVDDTIRESQQTIDLSAALASSLEREDDALLLAVSGNPERARQELARERARADDYYHRLQAVLATGEPGEQEIAGHLRGDIDRYRAAADELLGDSARPTSLERYHLHVNPLLRQAVTACGQLREENFRSMREAGLRARDEAYRATWVVSVVASLAVAIALVVAFRLARTILRPVQALTGAVEALRQGNFERRVPITTADELGQLAAGFNRMAEALVEYRRSSLGELLASKSTLEATLNALPDAVLVVAPDGSIAALNAPAQTLLTAQGVPHPRQLQELPFPSEHRTAVEAALDGRFCSPARIDFQQSLAIVFDGRPRRFMVTAVPIPDFAPGRFGAVVVLADVTEFARLDELRGELIGVASHELKTPLTTLRMNLLMLGEQVEALTNRQQELLQAALAGCEELGGTIDELLDMTRIEAGQLRLHMMPVEVSAVLKQVCRALQPRFDDAHVHVRLTCDAPTMQVKADAARLAIVLSNLMTNALKYSPPGSTVTAHVMPGISGMPSRTAMLHITVADQGPGVPAEFRERIFDKFFRVEHELGSSGNGVRGTGIGLYLCREIIKAHGGTITCGSGEKGAGTRFAVSLPADS